MAASSWASPGETRRTSSARAAAALRSAARIAMSDADTDFTPEVIVVGHGLAGLVATHELALAGKRVLVLDQENRNNLGGQAFWSLGGLFFVDSPEQRRVGIKDSHELALQDWMGSAQFDRLGDDEGRQDFWPRQWAAPVCAARRSCGGGTWQPRTWKEYSSLTM